MKPYQKVDVKVKVMEVKEPVQLVEKKKQDIYVSDSFGFAKATLWEENIGKKELGKSYFLEAYYACISLLNTCQEKGVCS